jgi:hypothetical protein
MPISAPRARDEEDRADEKKVLGKLLVDEGDAIKNLDQLVDKAKEIFLIEKPLGTVKFLRFGELSDRQRIAALLLGKYFAHRLEILTDSSLGISQVARELGRPVTAMSGPMGDLVASGLAERLPTRKYRAAYHRLPEIIELLQGRVEKRKALV